MSLSPSPSLEATRLSCARGGRRLFSDVAFAVGAGEALRVAGPNGSGKSSLLRILCGLAQPAGGEVRWHGESIRGRPEAYFRELFYCGHAPGIKDDLPAWKNMQIACRLAGGACTLDDARAALALFGLEHALHLPCAILSQGQRRRVALARLGIAPLPRLLVLDEPFTALDQHSAATLHAILERHLADGGIVVYTTHQELALEGRRLHVLDLGRTS
jgi:heme exporter protein A